MRLDKSYQPKLHEQQIYSLWEQKHAFEPSIEGDPYSIVMPPPNANANLHMGYELTAALEDIMARYQRSLGRSVLLVPGADHAGFETQSVYEKHLAKQGRSRFDFSRDSLYQQIWDFVAENRVGFETMIRRMGVSCDWSKFTFTLDDKIVKRAYATFKQMWDDGLIYRGERLVNFCTYHGTAFADIEVVYKEEQGSLWYIKYPLVDGEGEIVVATTRPETMLGDTAVAVNPKDKRYQDYIGKSVKLPLTNREIPILADEFVDMKYATGAVKITPAHDPNDFEVGKRHDLPFISVITHEGKIAHDVPEAYRGLNIAEARQKIVIDLKGQGLLAKTRPMVHSVGHCYKCGTIIEPLLKDQWFVNMQPLAKEAIGLLNSGGISFYPESKKDELIRYLTGLKDWNISRQIAWGIPIPAFQSLDDPEEWIYDERVDQELIKVDGREYRRDPDTFDTWFSSSSWPYATLDYPDGDSYRRFYPLSVMETGSDILYPWVSRMIMLGLYVTKKPPFKSVYLHGYIRSEEGLKMSKSLGNVVDPMPLIEEYGSDAVRIGIIGGQAPGANRNFDPRNITEARNFCNKLWNIARFISEKVDSFDSEGFDFSSDFDHWIVGRYRLTKNKHVKLMNDYRFSEAYENIYHFIWDDLADWYIEASKNSPNPKLLIGLLKAVLVMVHPFAPFLSETIWQSFSLKDESLLSQKQLIDLAQEDKALAKRFSAIRELIIEVRSIQKLVDSTKAKLFYDSGESQKLVADFATLIKQLTKLSAVEKSSAGQGIAISKAGIRCRLSIDEKQIERYIQRLDKQIAEEQALVKQLEGRLSNEGYIKKAPDSLVKQSRKQLELARDNLKESLSKKRRLSL